MPKRSKIEQMPAALRAWLDEALLKNNFSRYDLLVGALRERGAELGLQADVSKSGLHRYGTKLERRLSAIKSSTEAAKLIAQSSPDDEDHRSAAVISLIQTELFEALVSFQEAEEADPNERLTALSKAAKNIATLTRASVGQKRHELEVRSKVQTAAKEISKLGKKGGLSADVIRQIEEQVLGIAR